MPYRFTKQQRLLNGAEYRRAFKASKKYTFDAFSIYVSTYEQEYPRLGLAISKRHAPTAVQRNSVKRVIREVFRLNYEALPAVDIIIVSRIGITQLSKQQLREQVQAFLIKLSVLSHS